MATGIDPGGSGERGEHAQSGHHHHHHHGHHHHHSGCGCGGALPLDMSALISARQLAFARGGRDILSGIDIDIHQGEIVTLIGPNGGGKTTLVKLLVGIETPDSGRIHRAAQCSIGYVPQRFDVERALPMTVARFLALGHDVTNADVMSALEEVGAARTRDTQVSNLSGGEMQRVLIARALLRQPDVLVLDEPVRGVDMIGEADLYNLIGRLRDSRKFAVLLVSHDMHVVMGRSDRVICVNHHVCCSGKPETVSQHPEYARMFGADMARSFGVYRHDHDHTHDLTGAHHASSSADQTRGAS